MNPKKAALFAATLIALAVALGACGGGSSDATAGSGSGGGGSEPTTITYQEYAGLINVPELAESLGYLGNLKLKSVGAVTGGPESIQAVATGQSDLSGGAFNGSIVKAISAGAPVKAVIGAGGSNAKSYEGLFALDDSSIHSAKDLVGKKIGVNTLGANEEAFLKLWLKKEGLTPEEIGSVEMVVIPPLNAEQALREKQLDAVVLIGALRELGESKGGIRLIAKDTDALGDYNGNSLVVNDSFLEDHPQASRELVTGLAKATNYLETTPAPQVIKFAEKVATEHGRPEDGESLKYWKSQGIINKGGVIEPKEFSTWINWLEEEGELEPGQVKVDETYTDEFNPYGKGQ